MAFTDATETVVTYNLNGSQREFNIPFDYLSRSFVQVSVFGENTDKRLVVGDDYNYLDSRTISTVRALGGSDGWKRLQIRRYTSDDRIVDFKDGSVLKSADLNVAVVQALHIAAEGRDGKFDLMGVNSEGNWDALDRKINRLAPGTERRDAVNLGQVQDWSNSALNQADRAKREADNAARSAAAAKTSETNAKTSETNAKTSETNSKASENAAKSSATSANSSMTEAAKSQVAAKTSETNAKSSEGSAKGDADRSYREAERAKGYASSMGNAIDIGNTISEINNTTYSVTWKGSHGWRDSRVGVSGTYGKFYSPDGKNAIWIGAWNSGTVEVGGTAGSESYSLKLADSGVVATREWVGDRFARTASNTVVMPPDKAKMSLVVDNNNSGFYRGNAWMFRVDQNGSVWANGGMRIGSSEYSGIDIVQHTGRYFRIENTPHGSDSFANIMKREANGTITARLKCPQEVGMIATREWVGFRVGEEFKWKTSTGNHDEPWTLQNAMSNMPSNLMLSRIQRNSQWNVDIYVRRIL